MSPCSDFREGTWTRWLECTVGGFSISKAGPMPRLRVSAVKFVIAMKISPPAVLAKAETVSVNLAGLIAALFKSI